MEEPRKFPNRWGAFALLLAVIAPYSINFNSFWLMDDTQQIARGIKAISLRSLVFDPFLVGEHLFRPTMILLSKLDGLLWGVRPWGFRLSNYILFVASGFLVWKAARRFLNPLQAWLAALIFVIHPIQVGTVVWLSGRGDLLPATFLFASAVLLLGRGQYRPVAGHLFFAFALLSKETAVVFPPAILLGELMGGATARQAIRRTLPSAIMSFTYITIRIVFGFIPGVNYNNPMVVAHHPIALIRDGMSLALNTSYILLPFVHPMDIMRIDFPSSSSLFGLLFNAKTIIPGLYMVLSFSLIVMWVFLNIRHSPGRKSAFFGIFWFFLFLAPPIHVMANLAGCRYFFIPLLGGTIIIVLAGSNALSGYSLKTRRLVVAAFLSICIIVNIMEQIRWRQSFNIAERLTLKVVKYTETLPPGTTLYITDLPQFSSGGRLVYPRWDPYSLPMSVGFMGGRKDVVVRVAARHFPECDQKQAVCVTASDLLDRNP